TRSPAPGRGAAGRSGRRGPAGPRDRETERDRREFAAGVDEVWRSATEGHVRPPTVEENQRATVQGVCGEHLVPAGSGDPDAHEDIVNEIVKRYRATDPPLLLPALAPRRRGAEKVGQTAVDGVAEVLSAGRHDSERTEQEAAQGRGVELEQGQAVRRVEFEDRSCGPARPDVDVTAPGGPPHSLLQQAPGEGPDHPLAVQGGLGREVDVHGQRIRRGVAERGMDGELLLLRGDQTCTRGLFEGDIHGSLRSGSGRRWRCRRVVPTWCYDPEMASPITRNPQLLM
ncbi:hypothetical protein STRTUCAR8_00451, partial [Streptomyces turgidiscabies Car8]